MALIKKIWNLIGSRDLSVYIFITALVYVFFLLIFSAFVPRWWVSNISRLLPFKLLFGFFFINLFICELKWVSVVVRRCKKFKVPQSMGDCRFFTQRAEFSNQEAGSGYPDDPISGSEYEEPSNSDESTQAEITRVKKYLKLRGYSIHVPKFMPEKIGTSENSKFLYASRGRFAALGNLLFHLSFLLLLAGAFVSIFYRYEHKVLLMEGQEYVSRAANAGSPVSKLRFTVENISPQFWEGELLFTYLGALLRHDSGEEIAMLSRGVNMHGARVTIGGISYTPKYVLRRLGANVLDVGYVNLANFVPGTVDHFKIPGFPYKIYVYIYPDFNVNSDGNIETKSMNLDNPKYVVSVVRGKIPVYSGVLTSNDEAYFDGFGLAFPEIKYNGTLSIVRDPGEWLVWAAFVFMLIGLIWKLLLYRKEVFVVAMSGKITLFVNSDYYPELFLKKCLAVMKDFN